MKRVIFYALCALLAIAGSGGSIYLAGRSSQASLRIGERAIAVSPGIGGQTNYVSRSIVSSGDVALVGPEDSARKGKAITPDPNLGDMQIPLVIFQKNNEAGNSICGLRGFWNPVQGTLEMKDKPSLLASSTETAFYELIRSTHWDGGDRIAYVGPMPLGPEWHLGPDRYFKLIPTGFEVAADEYPGLLYCTPQGTAFLAFSTQNRLGLLAERDGKSTKEIFSANATSSNDQSYVFPLLLAHTGQDLLVLAAVHGPAAENRDRLCLIKIGPKGADYIPVRDSFDKYLAGQPANSSLSFIAGAGVRAAVCGQRIYVGDICGEDAWSFGLNDAAPVLSYETEINRQTRPWIQTHPSEGSHIPSFYSYGNLLIVAVGANDAEGFWAFRDGKLLGEISIEHNSQVRVFAGSNPDRVALTKALPDLITIMMPSAESSTL